MSNAFYRKLIDYEPRSGDAKMRLWDRSLFDLFHLVYYVESMTENLNDLLLSHRIDIGLLWRKEPGY